MSRLANVWLDPLEALRYEDIDTWITRDRPSEGDRLDFKQEFAPSVTASIVAMANHDGGLIIVGVAEQSDTQGQAKRAVWPPKMVRRTAWQETLTNACFNDIRPAHLPSATFIPSPDDPNHGLVLIRVDAYSAPRPLWHKDKGVLWRLGDQNRPADLDILRRLIGQEGAVSAGGRTVLDIYCNQVAVDRCREPPVAARRQWSLSRRHRVRAIKPTCPAGR